MSGPFIANADMPGEFPDHIQDLSQNADAMDVDEIGIAPLLPVAGPIRRRRKKAPTMKASDWQPYEAEIKRLYMAENRSLPEVMEIMKSRGLTASKKQYKTQISTWGFEKNIRWQEKQQMLRSIRESRVAGRQIPIFVHNGKKVNEAKMERFRSRPSRSHLPNVFEDRANAHESMQMSLPTGTDEPDVHLTDITNPPSLYADDQSTLPSPLESEADVIELPRQASPQLNLSSISISSFSGREVPTLDEQFAALSFEDSHNMVSLPNSYQFRDPHTVQSIARQGWSAPSSQNSITTIDNRYINPACLDEPYRPPRLEHYAEARERALRRELLILHTTTQDAFNITMDKTIEYAGVLYYQGLFLECENFYRRVVVTLWRPGSKDVRCIGSLFQIALICDVVRREEESWSLFEQVLQLTAGSDIPSLRGDVWRARMNQAFHLLRKGCTGDFEKRLPNILDSIDATQILDRIDLRILLKEIQYSAHLLDIQWLQQTLRPYFLIIDRMDSIDMEKLDSWERYNLCDLRYMRSCLGNFTCEARLALLQAVIEISEEVFDPRSTQLFYARNDLTGLLLESGHEQAAVDNARDLMRDVLEAPKLPYYVTEYQESLVIAYDKVGDYDAALPVQEFIYQETCRRHGPDSEDSIVELRSLVRYHDRVGNYGAALPLQQLLYQDTCRRFGADDEDSWEELENLGRNHRLVGNHDEAHGILTGCHEYRLSNLGEDHEDTRWVADELRLLREDRAREGGGSQGGEWEDKDAEEAIVEDNEA